MRRAVLIAAIAFTCACGKKERDTDVVLARVGSEIITQSEFDRKISAATPDYAAYIATPEGKKQFLDILIREKLILAAARAGGVEKDTRYALEAERARKDLERKYGDFTDYLKTKLWLEKLREQGVLAVSSDEIAAYYNRNPKEVSIEHILLAGPEHAGALLKRLKSGASFEEAARESSTDAETAPGGGKIPPFIRGQFLPEIEDAAFSMRNGEIRGVIKSNFGWHIIKKTGERVVPLSEAQGRIALILEKKKLDEYLKILQSKYRVEVIDEKYKNR